jgi:16S rRNA (cytidine1402-2'-O)-methyltransferase
MFAGFLPNAKGARKKALAELAAVPGTLAFYESPKRVAAMLADAAEVLGDRPAAVCRELTKKFEECRRGSLTELSAFYSETQARGEIVVLIEKGNLPDVSETDVEQKVKEALETMSVRDAADHVSAALGVKRRPVYQMAMKLAQGE